MSQSRQDAKAKKRIDSEWARLGRRRPSSSRRARRRHARSVNMVWGAADYIITTLVILFWIIVGTTSSINYAAVEKLFGG